MDSDLDSKLENLNTALDSVEKGMDSNPDLNSNQLDLDSDSRKKALDLDSRKRVDLDWDSRCTDLHITGPLTLSFKSI